MAHAKVVGNSILASLLNVLGSLLIMGGIALFFRGQFVPGIAAIIAAVGAVFLGTKISERKAKKQEKKLKKQYAENPDLPVILKNSCIESLLFVKNFPTEESVETVEKYNPYAASQIKRFLANEITEEELNMNFRMTDMANKKSRKNAGEAVENSNGDSIAELEEQYIANEKKRKNSKLIRNILAVVFILMFLLSFWIMKEFRPDKEFVKYSYDIAENTYTAVDIIAIKACVSEETKTDGEQYECAFVDNEGITGVISIPVAVYNSDEIKPLIEAMADVNLNPEPVRFYGNTTSAVSVETEQWMEEKGYNLDQIAPVRIRGSLVPEKGVSTLGWTLFWLAAVLMLVWFVYLLMENWQMNQAKRMGSTLDYMRKQSENLN